MNFPTSGKPRLARLWISSRGIIPQKANIEDVKKGFCEVLDGRCCFTTSEALLLPFTRINILHRPSQVWQFSMWAVPLFLCLLQSFSCFYCDPLSKANKVTVLLPLLGNALLLAAETMTQLLHRVRLLSALQFNPGSTSHLGFKPVKAKEALVFHAYVQKYRITNLRRWQRMSTAVRWYSCLKKREKVCEINKCMGGWCWEKKARVLPPSLHYWPKKG